MNITEEELCFEAERIATLRGADLLAKSWGENQLDIFGHLKVTSG